METTKLSIKLLVDKKANRVLFAEAGKDFVDFLFSLLSLPLGSVITLIRKKKMVGCLGNLYESVENFSSTYFQPNLNKDSLLNPKITFSAGNIPLLLPTTPPKYYMCSGSTFPCGSRSVTNTAGTRCPACGNPMNSGISYVSRGNPTTPPKYYMCSGSFCANRSVTDTAGTRCTSCGIQMNSEISYVSPLTSKEPSSSTEGGIVKGVVTYMIMDDLVVTPMSTISGITLLTKFNVQNVSYLDERMVDISMDEGLELLRASFWSTSVLTEVFMGTKKEKEPI